jgi:hypothetical protein
VWLYSYKSDGIKLRGYPTSPPRSVNLFGKLLDVKVEYDIQMETRSKHLLLIHSFIPNCEAKTIFPRSNESVSNCFEAVTFNLE